MESFSSEPCPTCKQPNRMTAMGIGLGYHCEECTIRCRNQRLQRQHDQLNESGKFSAGSIKDQAMLLTQEERQELYRFLYDTFNCRIY